MKSVESEAHMGGNEIRFRQIVSLQLSRYPKMAIEDLYKLIYQGAMGSEHAVNDPDEAKRWLEEEIANLRHGPEEPWIDPISISGEIVRINLRPYVNMGGKPEAILEAFLQSANEYPGSKDELLKNWAYAEMMAIRGELKFTSEELAGFIGQMKESNFPAIHHSERYQEHYQPAYRVVAFATVTGLMQV